MNPLRPPSARRALAPIAALVALLTGGSPRLHAQLRWSEPINLVRTPVAGRFHAVAAQDLDRDGALDLVWSGQDQDRVQRGLGGGLFADPTTSLVPPGNDTNRLVFFDADGDGDADLLRARGLFGAAQSQLYFNDGTGRFTDVTAGRLPPAARQSLDAAAGDVDGDGDVDLVIAGDDGLVLLVNDGTGRFTDVSAAQLPPGIVFAAQVVLRDLDRDGDLDLVIANTVGLSLSGTLYRNDGAGRFTDVTSTQYRSVWSARSRHVAVGDLDGDGDPDIVFVDAFTMHVVTNDGAGGFDDDPRVSLPPWSSQPVAAQLGDIDGDGDLDLVFAYNFGASLLWRNDGSMRFTALPNALPARQALTDARFCDFDGDGDLDLAFASQVGRSDLYTNDGSGVFTLATPYPIPDGSNGSVIATGDLDGDGDADVITGALVALRNDGKSRFTAQPFGTVAPFSPRPVALALGDVDGDGDLDAFAAMLGFLSPAAQPLLWLNDGRGNLTDATGTALPAAQLAARDAVFHDVDRDGDIDILVATAGPEAFWRNDGAGRFTDASAALPPTLADTSAIRAGDVDGDGYTDLVATDATGLRLYLGNAGATAFSDASARLPALPGALCLALFDVDGDRDLDVLAGTSAGLTLLLNDGRGNFAVATGRVPTGLQACDRLLAADVDGDGDADCLVGRSNAGLRTVLLRNDGTGRFTDTSALFPADTGMTGLAVADVDDDGDVDLLIGNMGTGLRLYRDLARQLQLVLPPRVGRPVAFDAWAKPGFAPSASVAAILIAPREARIPVAPFGVLGLDPATMALLATLPIPAPGGHATLGFTMPADASLAGVPVACQALIVDVTEARLTNVDSATIH